MTLPQYGTNPAPWAADSLTHIQGQIVQPVYWLECYENHFGIGHSVVEVPAWDIEVTLDCRRNPYGTLKATIPLSAPPLSPFSDYNVVNVKAGYRRAGGDDVHTLFHGFVTRASTKYDRNSGNMVRTIEAQTGEIFYDHPIASGTWNINNGTTIPVQFNTHFNGSPARFYRPPCYITTEGTLSTPASGAQTAYNNLEIEAGTTDSLDDWFHNMAETLGQWLRGDVRNAFGYDPDTHPHPGAYVISDDYGLAGGTPPSGLALPLDGIYEEVNTNEDLDEWAAAVALTCKWPSGDTWTTKQRLFGNLSVNEPAGGLVKVRSVEATRRPPGGVLSSTDLIGNLWADRLRRRTGDVTVTARAAWWLQPKMYISLPGVTVNTAGGAPYTFQPLQGSPVAQISAVTFLVDQGLMSITADPGN